MYQPGTRVRIIESNGTISRPFTVTAHSGQTVAHTVLSDEGLKFNALTAALVPMRAIV